MSRNKFIAKNKIEIIEAFTTGKVTHSQLREAYGMHPDTIYRWVAQYQANGIAAFSRGNGNTCYSKEFKVRCVEEYLRGEGSLNNIIAKYNISDTRTLRNWIMWYNANIELKDYNPKREVYMASARRKTTLDERKVIAEYCIAHDKDYKGTAALFSVSYSQVYSWVRKYLSEGEEGLTDKRGHHKSDDEVDELERLRRKIQQLERQLEDEKRTVALLKKVNELEGM